MCVKHGTLVKIVMHYFHPKHITLLITYEGFKMKLRTF